MHTLLAPTCMLARAHAHDHEYRHTDRAVTHVCMWGVAAVLPSGLRMRSGSSEFPSLGAAKVASQDL